MDIKVVYLFTRRLFSANLASAFQFSITSSLIFFQEMMATVLFHQRNDGLTASSGNKPITQLVKLGLTK